MRGFMAFIVLLASCKTLPALENRPQSVAPSDTGNTKIGQVLAPLLAQHPNKSGIYALQDSQEAFVSRVVMTHVAERTLDVQYYIWRNDITGTVLFGALRAAADRGVRVRLLLDDNNTSDLDKNLAVLDAHPNIEVRLFNPFVYRGFRLWGYISDFSRLNRRMHNKSFTIDNQVTIIGGRNIGDEYFGATEGALFVDLDVLAVGPVVRGVSHSFDEYWSSDSSYPVDRILPAATEEARKEVDAAATEVERSSRSINYAQDVLKSPFLQELAQGTLEFEWAHTYMLSDSPSKGLGIATKDELLTTKMQPFLGEKAKSVCLVSPYFVPTDLGVEAFSKLAAQGTKIAVLTNALEATDVTAVHAGYAKSRIPLLKSGVTLYEFRKRQENLGRRRRGYGESSGTSLHAKTFAIDGEKVFIGSFNFDPRSADLNTEMGFIIDSSYLAQAIEKEFREGVPEAAYELRLSPEGEIYWLERKDGKIIRHDSEPGSGFWRRLWLGFLEILPIDWLL